MIIHGSAIRAEGSQWGLFAIKEAYFNKNALHNIYLLKHLVYENFENLNEKSAQKLVCSSKAASCGQAN